MSILERELRRRSRQGRWRRPRGLLPWRLRMTLSWLPSRAARRGAPPPAAGRDEGLHHLVSAIGLRSRLGDPLVLASLEDVQIALAAGRPVRRRELFLHRRQHGVVEGALHDQERDQRDWLAPIEDLLRIALEDGLPGPEVRLVVLDHRLALHPLG